MSKLLLCAKKRIPFKSFIDSQFRLSSFRVTPLVTKSTSYMKGCPSFSLNVMMVNQHFKSCIININIPPFISKTFEGFD